MANKTGNMKIFKVTLAAAAFSALLLTACNKPEDEFLRTDGKRIINGKGDEILLKGIGLGGWMLQEPYMLDLSDVAKAQYDIKNKIEALIGEEKTDNFYKAYIGNMITCRDIDSLKAWGFNSIRLPMHYNLFTLPSEEEPVAGNNTWKEDGFALTDSLLAWCADNKIWVILDLHAAPGGQGNDIPIADIDTTKPRLWESEQNRQKTIELWKKLAARYADNEWVGGYDLINETNYPLEGNAALKKLFIDITEAIRTVDKKHILFIEGNRFANDFTGLTPAWDGNMAYSFHKYWTPTTTESIKGYLVLRGQTNAPLWMGESGENSNDWYRSAIDLFETNKIGWAWWTIKKLRSDTGLMTVTTPEGYDELVNYWAGKGPAPAPESAYSTLMQLAENMKIENCRINYPVINALFGK